MPHLDPDVIALAALGEPLPADQRRHLDTCADCARELAELTAVVGAGRAAGGEALVPAPDAVWERISAELGLAPGVAPAESGGPVAVEPAAGRAPVAAESAESAAPVEPAAVTDLGSRRAPRGRWLLAAAAGLVVGGVAGGAVVAGVLRPDPETVLAEAQLDALPGWTASGDAFLEEDPEGRRTLVVRVSPTEADGFRAVWLLDADATRLVSLGALEGDEGRFAIPVGLDLDEFPVVDVSVEPFDGDPGHSGDSIVRGALDREA